MTRAWWVAVGSALLMGAAGMAPTEGPARKNLSVKEIMTRAHKGGDSLLARISADLKADEPRWTDCRKKTRELVRLADQLSEAKPPRGEKKSWVRLANDYLVTAKVLDASVGDKDRKASLGAYQKLRMMCATCHKAHRGKK